MDTIITYVFWRFFHSTGFSNCFKVKTLLSFFSGVFHRPKSRHDRVSKRHKWRRTKWPDCAYASITTRSMLDINKSWLSSLPILGFSGDFTHPPRKLELWWVWSDECHNAKISYECYLAINMNLKKTLQKYGEIFFGNIICQ